MKTILLSILLIVTTTCLGQVDTISFSQIGDRKILKLTIAYYGDSTLLMEKYEIDFSMKKVFYITPVANYLHIEGKKLREKISLTKKEWEEIARLALMIDFKKLVQYAQSNNTQKDIYSIERILNHGENLELKLTEGNVPEELKKLFKIIRNLN